MTHQRTLSTLVAALRESADIQPTIGTPLRNAVFVGSGDSLSSALLAQAYGHTAASSGGITFTGRLPLSRETVVGVSHSGTSGATVQAVRIARKEGLRTIAITSNADSPLAQAAQEVQIVPALTIDEVVPCSGHLMLSLGVAAVCGENSVGATTALAELLTECSALVEHTVDCLPDQTR